VLRFNARCDRYCPLVSDQWRINDAESRARRGRRCTKTSSARRSRERSDRVEKVKLDQPDKRSRQGMYGDGIGRSLLHEHELCSPGLSFSRGLSGEPDVLRCFAFSGLKRRPATRPYPPGQLPTKIARLSRHRRQSGRRAGGLGSIRTLRRSLMKMGSRALLGMARRRLGQR
jgi:hypothetical protein